MRRHLIAIFLLALLSACSTPGMLTTTTGRPEITIPGQTIQTVSNALAEWNIAHGFDITRTTFFSMESERVADSSHNNGIGSQERVLFNYAETSSGVHLVGDFRSSTEGLGDIVERKWLQNELSSIAQKLSTH